MSLWVELSARALSARFSLTGGRFNYERTVGEKNSPQWLPRSGALREQRDRATRKEKQIMIMYKRIESKENARTLWMATGSFVFRGLVLYHSLDLLSWQPSLWKTCEQSPRLFPLFVFFFRDGRRLCTQANTTKFGSICFYPAFSTTLLSKIPCEQSLLRSS